MQTYVIQSGDSLSSIAKKFKRDEWKPIWNYNTAVRKTLTSGKEELIHPGVEIVIPRTKAAYEKIVKSLRNLMRDLDFDLLASITELDGIKRDSDRHGKNIDFVSDIAMIGKGSVKAVLKLGSKRLLKYKLRKDAFNAIQRTALEIADLSGSSNEEQVVQQTGKAAVDQMIHLQAGRDFDIDKGVTSFTKGMAKGGAKKVAGIAAKAVAVEEEQNAVADIVGIIAEGLITGLDSISPSKVAKTVIRVWTGEHPDDTYKRSKTNARNAHLRSKKNLKESIKRLEKEVSLVYPENSLVSKSPRQRGFGQAL